MTRALAAAVAVSIAFLGAELAAGGFGFGGEQAPRPCQEREDVRVLSVEQQRTLRVVDRFACRLGMSREELVLEVAERGDDLLDARRDLGEQIEEWVDRIDDALGG